MSPIERIFIFYCDKSKFICLLVQKMVGNLITEEIKNEIYKEKHTPKLSVILVGRNYASEKYVNNKIKKAKEIGIDMQISHFENDVSESLILNEIDLLNNDNEIHGIFVQLPIPKNINVTNIINYIDPNKDVDGFHPTNLVRLMLKDGGIKSCTPYGIMKLLQYYKIPTIGKNVTIIGTSNIVGKPLSNMLMNEEATITNCNAMTKDLKSHTINARNKSNYKRNDKRWCCCH